METSVKLYVYADESGAFDKVHNDWFVYGGLVLVGSDAKEDATRRFMAIEKGIRETNQDHADDVELKASHMSLKERKRSFTSIKKSGCHQFAVIVDQRSLHDGVFDSKQRKQRFLDYALKRGIKDGIIKALRSEKVGVSEVDAVSVVVDEHSTSTCGKYNLVESINEELRYGMFNPSWSKFFPPLFGPRIPRIPVSYVDSSKVALVRAADVTANWVYMAVRDMESCPSAYDLAIRRVSILRLP